MFTRKSIINNQQWWKSSFILSQSRHRRTAAIHTAAIHVAAITTSRRNIYTRIDPTSPHSYNKNSNTRNLLKTSFSCNNAHNAVTNIHRTFNSKSRATPHSNANPNKDEDTPGIFSIPNLHQPSDFLKLATQAIHTCNDLRQQIHNSLESSSNNDHQPLTLSPRETLYTLDDISNTVCSVIDASELCRSVHANPEWREAASNAFQLLSEYIADLNTDEALYQSLLPIVSNSQIMNVELEEEERRMAILLKKEFERDGIHLSTDKRNEVRQLNGFVTQLETMFSENLMNQKVYELEDGLVHDVKQIIPNHALMDIQSTLPPPNTVTPAPITPNANSQQQNAEQGYTSVFSDSSSSPIRLSTEPHITNTILRHSPSPRLRQKVYMESNTACVENLQVLDALIARRHELATTIGYPSYTHYFTSDKMAQDPKTVMTFLKSVDQACNVQYNMDLELVMHAKQHVEGGGGGSPSSEQQQLHPWDLNFYNGLYKSQLFQNHDGNGDGEEVSSLSGYFTVEQSLEGMKVLVQKLFGIAMEEVNTDVREQWDVPHHYHSKTGNDSLSSPSSSIRKFNFFKEEDGKPLGTIYFDLHPRDGKYNHAAHFTIQCGCESRKKGEVGQYQLPIVAVVCNLSPPFSVHAGQTASLLSHSEVETLFHEFGHALHSLLARTKFQHLSGTRTAMDFVETPSHLMEFFVWNKEFLNIIGRHYITGEPIPDITIDKLVKSRNMFKAMDIKSQVVYGLFDQMIFGPPELWRDESSNNSMSTSDLFASLHREHNVPFADGTHWHSKFGHLVTYGGGYYSYLYASIFSADLWNTCFEGGSKAMDREVGMSYWNEILVHGGAKDPNLMLKSMLGREPKADEFFKFH
jgi:intermediate peptidase